MDRRKLERLPETFGPGPINRVVRESVQSLVDASFDQKEVSSYLNVAKRPDVETVCSFSSTDLWLVEAGRRQGNHHGVLRGQDADSETAKNGEARTGIITVILSHHPSGPTPLPA